jgi:hypothetical protein
VPPAGSGNDSPVSCRQRASGGEKHEFLKNTRWLALRYFELDTGSGYPQDIFLEYGNEKHFTIKMDEYRSNEFTRDKIYNHSGQ